MGRRRADRLLAGQGVVGDEVETVGSTGELDTEEDGPATPLGAGVDGVDGGSIGSEGRMTGLATGEALPDGDGDGVGVVPPRSVQPELSQVQVSPATPPVAELAP